MQDYGVDLRKLSVKQICLLNTGIERLSSENANFLRKYSRFHLSVHLQGLLQHGAKKAGGGGRGTHFTNLHPLQSHHSNSIDPITASDDPAYNLFSSVTLINIAFALVRLGRLFYYSQSLITHR